MGKVGRFEPACFTSRMLPRSEPFLNCAVDHDFPCHYGVILYGAD